MQDDQLLFVGVPMIILSLNSKLNISCVTDNSSISTVYIPTSSLVEPCTLCNGKGNFDYKDTDNATDLDNSKEDSDDSLSDDTVLKHYNCTQEIEQLDFYDKNSYTNWEFIMLSIEECTELKEQCIDCQFHF